MGFAERYVQAVSASNLKDDEHNHQTDPLTASALADKSARDIGALLHRVKYANTYRQIFEGDNAALLALRRAWIGIVSAKGRERKWIRDRDWPTMGSIFPAMADRIATHSLAHYLDGQCKGCGGTGKVGQGNVRSVCKSCNGTCRAELPPMNNYEKKLAEDMVGELMALESTHAGIGSAKLRAAA